MTKPFLEEQLMGSRSESWITSCQNWRIRTSIPCLPPTTTWRPSSTYHMISVKHKWGFFSVFALDWMEQNGTAIPLSILYTSKLKLNSRDLKRIIYIYSSWSTYTTQTKVTTQSKMLHVLDNFQGIPTKNAFLTIQNLPLAVPKKNFPPVKSSPDYRHGLPLDKRGLFLRPPGSRGANGNQLASRPAGEWRLMMKPQFQNRQKNVCFCLYYSSCWTRRVNQRF